MMDGVAIDGMRLHQQWCLLLALNSGCNTMCPIR